MTSGVNFVARLPELIIDQLEHVDFNTWTEAREAARRILAKDDLKSQKWLSEASKDTERRYHAKLASNDQEARKLRAGQRLPDKVKIKEVLDEEGISYEVRRPEEQE